LYCFAEESEPRRFLFCSSIQGIEICVDTLFQDEAARLGEMERVTAAVEEGINAGKHVVIFTSRQVGYDLILLF